MKRLLLGGLLSCLVVGKVACFWQTNLLSMATGAVMTVPTMAVPICASAAVGGLLGLLSSKQAGLQGARIGVCVPMVAYALMMFINFGCGLSEINNNTDRSLEDTTVFWEMAPYYSLGKALGACAIIGATNLLYNKYSK